MIEVITEINAMHRALVRQPMNDAPGVALVIERTYPDAPPAVWDAITTPERISRWFLPISGDLRPGGTFQLEGNAGGAIVHCAAPRELTLTWGLGGDPNTLVTVRLSEPAPGQTTLRLEHLAPAALTAGFAEAMGISVAAGTIAVGGGWDPALLGLSRELRGEPFDQVAWMTTPEHAAFTRAAYAAWGDALAAAGYVTPDEARAGVTEAITLFLPSADPA